MGPLFCPFFTGSFAFSRCNWAGFLYPPSIPAILEVTMLDVYQVLHEKELELIRVRQEVEALQTTLTLLVDDEDIDSTYTPPLAANDE
jgi:hypothetical protein